jgi:hypothetical protein
LSTNAASAPMLSWQVLLKLKGDCPVWDWEAVQVKLQELAEYLSRTMTVEITVLALVTESVEKEKGKNGFEPARGSD